MDNETFQKAWRVLERFGSLEEITNLGLSRRQALQIARLFTFTQTVRPNLPKDLLETFKGLGLQALTLSPLVERDDWGGIVKLLEAIETLPQAAEWSYLLPTLEAKRTGKRPFLWASNTELAQRLKRIQEEMKPLLERLNQAREDQPLLDWVRSHLQACPADIKGFLLSHLGVWNGRLCLARRLDERWQMSLRNKGILRYDEDKMIHVVEDPDALIAEAEQRTKRGWRREYKRKKGKPPLDPEYRVPSLVEGLMKPFHLKEFEDLQRQERNMLQILGARWLDDQGYVAALDFPIDGRLCDAIGHNEDGRIAILKVLAHGEKLEDNEWKEFMNYCDMFYFIVAPFPQEEIIETEVGILAFHVAGNGLRQVEQRPCRMQLRASEREKLVFRINRSLARALVY